MAGLNLPCPQSVAFVSSERKVSSFEHDHKIKPAIAFASPEGNVSSLQKEHAQSAAAMATRYRRDLPSPPAIAFTSSEGKQLFIEAIQSGTMEGFYSLISNFQTQSELTYCGLASLSMVLNSLSIDPGRKWKGPWRWFDENMLDCCEALEKVKAHGISFKNLVYLAHSAGAKVDAFQTNQSTMEEFRKHVMTCSTSDDCHVILSYHRGTLEQTGTGHYSPIGGYHAGRDMVLILDVARFKYPPHWVPLPLIWEAMDQINETTKQRRGFMLLSRPQRASTLLYTLTDDNLEHPAREVIGCDADTKEGLKKPAKERSCQLESTRLHAAHQITNDK